MKKLCLTHKKRKAKYCSYRGTIGPICNNEINRYFKIDMPLLKLATDITEFRIHEGKVYLSPILDMYNGEIIAYDIAYRADYAQIERMMMQLKIYEADLEGSILHSDQGWQYQMKQFQNQLKKLGIIQSMSRKGNCLDNAVMENFFGRMKTEMFYGKESSFKTLYQLKNAIKEYIEYYNTKRIKLKLDGLSPVAYRLKNAI